VALDVADRVRLDLGGTNGGTLAYCLAVEEISRVCGSTGLTLAAHVSLGTYPIYAWGGDRLRELYVPKLVAGEYMGAYGLTEPNAGSDSGGTETTAVLEGDEYVLNGEKKWTTNGGVADIYSVFCVTDPTSRSRRISTIIVEKGTPGFEVKKVEDKMGIRCVPVVETHFDHVRVPKANLIGGRPGMGFKHAMMTLDRARPGVAAQAMGLATGALELATRYTTKRQQFGQSIASFQMVQQLLADMATRTEAARQLIYATARAIEAGEKNVTKMSAMSKCFATDVAMQVTTDAVQLFGGYGYMKDYPIEKYMRDAKITQIYEGTNQIQRLVIARNVQKEAARLAFLDQYLPDEHQDVYEG